MLIHYSTKQPNKSSGVANYRPKRPTQQKGATSAAPHVIFAALPRPRSHRPSRSALSGGALPHAPPAFKKAGPKQIRASRGGLAVMLLIIMPPCRLSRPPRNGSFPNDAPKRGGLGVALPPRIGCHVTHYYAAVPPVPTAAERSFSQRCACARRIGRDPVPGGLAGDPVPPRAGNCSWCDAIISSADSFRTNL